MDKPYKGEKAIYVDEDVVSELDAGIEALELMDGDNEQDMTFLVDMTSLNIDEDTDADSGSLHSSEYRGLRRDGLASPQRVPSDYVYSSPDSSSVNTSASTEDKGQRDSEWNSDNEEGRQERKDQRGEKSKKEQGETAKGEKAKGEKPKESGMEDEPPLRADLDDPQVGQEIF